MGHRHGPESEQVIDAMEALDADLGRLFSGLRERDLFARMHILVVSDHGMAAVDLERYIALDEFIPLDRVRVSDWGPAAHIWAERISVEELEQRLQDAHPRLRVWRREQTPEHYRFRGHHRIADLIVEADLGWMVSSRRYMLAQRARPLGGMHGWDPLQRPMHGIMLAHGPAFGEGRTPPVAGVHLYSLMSHLLGIEPAPNDGDLNAWRSWLAGEYRTNAEPLPPPPVLYGDRYPQAPVADLAVPDLSQGRVSLRGDLVRQCRDDGERCRTRLQSGPDSVTLDLSGLGLDAPGERLGAATVAGHWQPGGFRAHSLLLHAPGVLGHHGRTDNDND